MPAATSPELRDSIIAWRFKDGLAVDDIAQRSGKSTRCIYRILSLQRRYGQPFKPPTGPRGRPSCLSNEDLDYLICVVALEPTIHLDELKDLLEMDRGVRVSLATISRTLARLNIKRKPISDVADEVADKRNDS